MHWLLHTSDTSGLPLLLASAGLTKFDFNRFAKDDGREVGIELKVVVKKINCREWDLFVFVCGNITE